MNFAPQSGRPGAPLHVAVIPDGNGRWARARGLPRLEGHRAGAEAVRRVVEAAPPLGVATLTIYAFSADNWGRPAAEVAGLFAIFEEVLRIEARRCAAEGVRLRVVGRRDRLPPSLRSSVEEAERATARGERMTLRLAVDYSARDSIRRAALLFPGAGDFSRESFLRLLGAVDHDPAPPPPVDLLLRTGGERRLSDFLLWENAYAELFFSRVMWPDFSGADLGEAVRSFPTRERRFGRIPGGSEGEPPRDAAPSAADVRAGAP
ncbi:MAG TPA: polyprenyl diphosphate synthase [Planctomycetota bacterium]|jgi:undecaprenyl diphosphate synthase|nr:polyprenyl diphosphate synthase [Planctomycetota bacterium]